MMIEHCWRVIVSPATRIVSCGIYLADTGVEVRAGIGPDIIRIERADDVQTARLTAIRWLNTARRQGGFN